MIVSYVWKCSWDVFNHDNIVIIIKNIELELRSIIDYYITAHPSDAADSPLMEGEVEHGIIKMTIAVTANPFLPSSWSSSYLQKLWGF
jgi:hypothetical protein